MNVVDYDMLYETEGLVQWEILNKWRWIGIMKEKKRVTRATQEDLDYDPKDDGEHILEDVLVSMNNFNFCLDTKHDLSIVVVEVYEYDIDVINYDSFGSDLNNGIDHERRKQLRELRRIGKANKQGPNKYYFYLGRQFAHKEIMKGRIKKHSVDTRRKLFGKNDQERIRVRREWTTPTLVSFDGRDSAIGKNRPYVLSESQVQFL
ncbi:hypothetical protein Tco_0567913 [Tanacetum coccineum]